MPNRMKKFHSPYKIRNLTGKIVSMTSVHLTPITTNNNKNNLLLRAEDRCSKLALPKRSNLNPSFPVSNNPRANSRNRTGCTTTTHSGGGGVEEEREKENKNKKKEQPSVEAEAARLTRRRDLSPP